MASFFRNCFLVYITVLQSLKQVTSIGPKFKTLKAMTGRIVELESKSSRRLASAQRSELADSRKKSLHFHRFITEKRTPNTEVARLVFREIKSDSAVSNMNLRDLLAFLRLEEDTRVISEVGFLKAVSANFDAIPPNLYSRLSVVLPSGNSLRIRIVDKVVSSVSVQESVCDWPCLAAHLVDNLDRVRLRKFSHLVHANAVPADLHCVAYMLQYILKSSNFRLLKPIESRLASWMEKSGCNNSSSLSLFYGDKSVDLVQLTDSLIVFVKFNRMSTRFKSLLDNFIFQQYTHLTVSQVMKVFSCVALPNSPRIIASIIRRGIEAHDAKLVLNAARFCQFDNRFQIRRLLNLDKSLDAYPNIHDEFFRKLCLLAPRLAHRKARRRFHVIACKIRVGQLTLMKPLPFKCKCKVCQTLKHELQMHAAFHV